MNIPAVIRRTREILGFHPRAAMLSVIALALSGFLASAAVGTWQGLLTLQMHMKEQLSLVAFLSRDLSPEELQPVMESIRSWPEVRKVEYLSSQDSLQRFLEDFPDEAVMVHEMGENPLPAIIQVLPKPGLGRQTMEAVRQRLQQRYKWIEEITSGEYSADRVEMLLGLIEAGGLLLTASVALAVVLIIMNTVRLLLSLYRREMELLRFLGASWSYAVLPFVLCGGILGGLGSALGVGVVLLVAAGAASSVGVDYADVVMPAMITAAGGLLLSFMGGLLAVRHWRES